MLSITDFALVTAMEPLCLLGFMVLVGRIVPIVFRVIVVSSITRSFSSGSLVSNIVSNLSFQIPGILRELISDFEDIYQDALIPRYKSCRVSVFAACQTDSFQVTK